MRIAQISTLDTPVRRDKSSSVEQHVWLLDRELVRLGHDVTVFAAAGSEVSGKLVETLPGTYAEDGAPDDWQLCEMINLCRALERSGEFDVLHSHAYLRGLPMEALSRAPMLHTLHLHPYDDFERLRLMWPDAWVTGLSHFQWSGKPAAPPCAVVYHGIDAEQFSFNCEPGDYVCYLGRFVPNKGLKTAIRVARELGLTLRIAGPSNEYFEENILQEIGGKIEYVGPVTGRGRDEFLGGAKALLYPLKEPEPFGLVQVEAMMCGTPVVALRVGAVAEIVDEGVTGYIADTVQEFTGKLARSFELDRRKVRTRAMDRFSGERMAREYAAVYERLIAARGAR